MIGSLNASYLNQLVLDGAYPFMSALGAGAQGAESLSASGAVLVDAAFAKSQGAESLSGTAGVLTGAVGAVLELAQSLASAAASLVDAFGTLSQLDEVLSGSAAPLVTADGISPVIGDSIGTSVWKSTQIHPYTSHISALHSSAGGMVVHNIHGSVVVH